MTLFFPQFVIALPEIILTLGGMFVLLFGVFKKNDATQTTLHIALGVILGVLFLETSSSLITQTAFSGLYVTDYFAVSLKSFILFSAFLILFSTRESLFHEGVTQFEYPALILLCIVGMMLMVSAYDLLTLFIGLELQSLSLYIMTTLRRDHQKSSEAGLKYFILGALSTCLLLYGISLLYGFSGTTNFATLAKVLASTSQVPFAFYIATTLIMAGLIFKISLVPFHMWTPDVYEGAPTSITLFLATAPKVAAFALIIRVMNGPLQSILPFFQDVLMVIAILSMVLGVFAALFQRNIKRIIAYSTIANMGYLTIGLIIGTQAAIQATLFYLFIYVLTLIGLFICLVNLSRKGYEIELVQDLAGLVTVNPGTTFAMSFFLFSFAGIPPLAGFLGKLYIFQAAIEGGFMSLAIIGVIASVVAAGYYLWIIKVMVMDSPLNNDRVSPVTYKRDHGLTLVLNGLIIGLTWIFVKPTATIEVTMAAARSLFLS